MSFSPALLVVTNDSRREGNKALRARVHHVVSLTWHRCQLFAEIAGKRTKHPFAGRAKECTDTLGEGRQGKLAGLPISARHDTPQGRKFSQVMGFSNFRLTSENYFLHLAMY